jgi:hypothetical protein
MGRHHAVDELHQQFVSAAQLAQLDKQDMQDENTPTAAVAKLN